MFIRLCEIGSMVDAEGSMDKEQSLCKRLRRVSKAL